MGPAGAPHPSRRCYSKHVTLGAQPRKHKEVRILLAEDLHKATLLFFQRYCCIVSNSRFARN
jgi:hypothetical protein